ncbi:SusE domain-containing protein [Pedobacter xixiisoli]|uniref:SusE outer membrane protein n=1 Tax=Pedobacter xixiisoli TaxID=1476464 RepID=A0A286A0B3_9SPHI|nr:SusE domain-containing protein [Pedobacter xixiisoli]SOD15344.1 SusE outer membrane protein [Pedobacter xixiisoli]
MKTKIFTQLALLLMVIVSFTSCKKKDELREVKVSEVSNLYEPADNRTVNLQPTATASVFFEWEKATADDNSIVYYDVLFDKAGGDFSKPIYSVSSDNKGTSSGLTITHRILNRIAALAGAASGEQAALKWTVVSSRGMSKTKSALSRNLTITRLEGIEAPLAVFISGEASEGGTDLSKAQQLKALDGGNEFEIYTRLTVGKKYHFVDSRQNVSRTFTVDPSGTSFKENNNGAEVAKTAVYKIKIDFLSGSVVIRELQSIGILLSDQNRVTHTFTYQGGGVWKLANYNVIFVNKGGWQEDRYKFVYTFNTGVENWGQLGNSDNRPNLATESYFQMKPVEAGAFTGVFKFANDFYDAANLAKNFVDVTITMNASGAYTHKMVKI